MPDLESVCESQLCASDNSLSQECDEFLSLCLAQVGEGSEDECIGGGLFICEGGVCGQDACAADQDLAQECRDFLGPCLEGADKDSDVEGCIAVGILKCGDGLF